MTCLLPGQALQSSSRSGAVPNGHLLTQAAVGWFANRYGDWSSQGSHSLCALGPSPGPQSATQTFSSEPTQEDESAPQSRRKDRRREGTRTRACCRGGESDPVTSSGLVWGACIGICVAPAIRLVVDLETKAQCCEDNERTQHVSACSTMSHTCPHPSSMHLSLQAPREPRSPPKFRGPSSQREPWLWRFVQIGPGGAHTTW